MPDNQAKQDALEPNLQDAQNAPAAAGDADAPAEGLAERDPVDRAAYAVTPHPDLGSAEPPADPAGDDGAQDGAAERADTTLPEAVVQDQMAAEATVYAPGEAERNIAPSDADSAAAEYGWRIGTGDAEYGAADQQLNTDNATATSLSGELADTYVHPKADDLADVVVDTPASTAPDEVTGAAVETGDESVAEADSDTPTEEELLRRENESRLKEVVSGILDDESADFSEVIGQASLQELVLLLEDLAQRDISRPNIRKVGQLKKQFDESYATQLQQLNALTEDESHPELHEEAKTQKAAVTSFSQRFSRALVSFNKRRTAFEESETQQRDANLQAKRGLLEELKAIVMAEDVAAIDKVRSIQARWRNVGQVPQADVDDVMQSYKSFLDRFYGLREKYNELLEQDRKVNLEEKQRLIVELEEMVGMPSAPFTLPGSTTAGAGTAPPDIDVANEAPSEVPAPPSTETVPDAEAAQPDPAPAEPAEAAPAAAVPTAADDANAPEAAPAELPAEKQTARYWQEAADRVKAMHEQWKHIGPVPREWTEPLWQRFKLATDAFYDQRRAFFGLRDEARGQNTERKRELVQQAIAYLDFNSTSKDAWMQASRELQNLMEAWKHTGPASQDEGKQLFKQFRDAQNGFFKKRAQYFASLNAQRGGLVEQKEALLARAEALQAEPESSGKADQFKALQREWKSTGPDDYKEARKLAKRFRKICDTFFSGLKEQMASQYREQEDNLERKQALLDQLEALLADGQSPSNTEVDPLFAEYDQLGHVPFKHKDRVNGRYRKLQDRYFQLFRRSPRRSSNVYSTGGGGQTPSGRGGHTGGGRQQAPESQQDREERRIGARLRQLDELVTQYENNILYITRGKSGDALRAETNQKIEAARTEQQQLKQELKALRRAAHAPAPAAETPAAAEPAPAPAAESASEAAPAPEATVAPAAEPEAQPTAEESNNDSSPADSGPADAPAADEEPKA